MKDYGKPFHLHESYFNHSSTPLYITDYFAQLPLCKALHNGKSHIAKALLLLGCRKLFTCRHTTASGMLGDLMASLCDSTIERKLKTYTKPQILLIDEVGFDRLEQESSRNASLFFKVINGRYCKTSTILTTNISFKELGDYLGDPVITTCLVDRMVHHSIIVNIDGPSWRMYESSKLNRPSTANPPEVDHD